MSIYIHPVLGIVWALGIAARIYLSFCVRIRFKAFRLYVWASTLMGCLLFAQSACNAPEWYWYTYWTGEILLHLIATAYLSFFCFDCIRFSPRLPKSLPAHVAIVMAMIPIMSLGCAAVKRSPVQSIWYVEQVLEIGCFVLAYIAVLCSKIGYVNGVRRQVMLGFLVLLTVGMAVSGVRVYFPLTRVTLWTVELWTQLGVSLWWVLAFSNQLD